MNQRVFPAHLDSLSALRKFVRELAQEARLSTAAAYRLQLAVDEIATNIITHGYEKTSRSGAVTVSAELSAGELTIILEDTGLPYDPRAHVLPSEEQLQLPLEERREGGLGLFLALRGVDQFDYQRSGDLNRNIFIMRRK